MKTDVAIQNEPQQAAGDLRKFNNTKLQVEKAIAACEAINITNPLDAENAITTLKLATGVSSTIEAKRKELVKPLNDQVTKINAFAKGLTGKLGMAIMEGKKKVIAFQQEELLKVKQLRKQQREVQLQALGFAIIDGFYQWQKIMIDDNMLLTMDDQAWGEYVQGLSKKVAAASLASFANKKEDLEALIDFGNADEKAAAAEELEKLQQTQSFADNGGFVPSLNIPAAEKVKGLTKRWTFEITDTASVPREYLVVDEVKIRKAITEGTRTIPGVRIYQEEGLTLR